MINVKRDYKYVLYTAEVQNNLFMLVWSKLRQTYLDENMAIKDKLDLNVNLLNYTTLS